jgi:DHA1 family multidrug resistance protein-like MFS transporter
MEMNADPTGTSSPQPDEMSFFNMIPSSNLRSVLAFCAANFFWWISLYLYVPVLPVYIQSSGANLNIVGVVLAAYSIPQVILRIPIGLWADRLVRRKSLVLAGMMFAALGALGLGISTDPWLLFSARMVVGIGAATWVVFTTYFTAYYPERDSGKAIGLLNFVRGGSLIAATAGGGFLADVYGFRPTFFGAAVLGILALFAMFFAKERTADYERAVTRRSFSSVITSPLLITVSIMGIMSHFAIFAGVFGFIPVYAAELGASSSQLGLITMINLGFSTAAALGAVWVWERMGYRYTIILGTIVSGVSLLAVPFIPSVPILMLIQICFGLGSGVLMTTLMALSIRNVPREHQATAMGIYQAVYAVGMLTGPLVSGFLGAELGLDSIFFAAASLSIVVMILAFLPVFPKIR